MSFAQPSENINFIASNVNDNVDKDISKEFHTLMSKYVKEPYMLQVLKNKLDDDDTIGDPNNFMKELEFQFPRYEPDIKKWVGRHVNMSMFYEYLKNLLLETVNKKYPVSVEEIKKVTPINNDGTQDLNTLNTPSVPDMLMNVGVDPTIDPQQTLNIPAEQIKTSFEKQQKVDETLKPDSKEGKVNKTQQLIVLSKETKIKQILEWVGSNKP